MCERSISSDISDLERLSTHISRIMHYWGMSLDARLSLWFSGSQI